MKILRLDPVAFGPFTGVSLALGDGQSGLHVVYGPNEAGKSSALRALRQMLFGIPHNSSDNFLHPHQSLRIAATLRSADGTLLECVRRKGKKNTLRSADEAEVIDPRRLVEMLGGVDEESFQQRFAIDYQELVTGGRAIVQGSGDLGEILFAAASGVADLGAVQKRLAEEAEALFKPRGSVQRINKAISELSEARKTIKAAQLPSSEWSRHDEALREAERRAHEVNGRLLQKGTEKQRLQRFDQALPVIAEHASLRSQLVELGDVPLLPENFSERRIAANQSLSVAQAAERDAVRTLESIQEKIAELDVPEVLLQHATAITQLHTDLGSFRKAARDRPALVARKKQLEDESRGILCQLGRDADPDQAENLQLSRAQRVRIQELGNQHQALVSSRRTAEENVRRLADQIEGNGQKLAALNVEADPEPLRRGIRQAQQHGDLDQRLAAERAELRQAEQQVAVDLEKLPLWSGSLKELETLAVPSLETIDRFEKQLAEIGGAVKGLEDRIELAATEAAELDRHIEQIRLEQDVPSEADLAEARRRRDEGWRLVRRAWLEGVPDNSAQRAFIADFPPAADLAQAYQMSVQRADQLADRLRREADGVAHKAKLTADRQKLNVRRSELGGQHQERQNNLAAAERQWRDLWAPLGIEPLSPREMRAWAGQQRALVTAAESVRSQQTGVDELDRLAGSHREVLLACLDRVGQPPATKCATLAVLVQLCEEIVNGVDEVRGHRQQLERDLEKQNEQAGEAERLAGRADKDLSRWRGQWAEAIGRLDLPAEASPAEANAVLSTIEDLLVNRKESDGLGERIEGIDHDGAQFTAAVQRLVGNIGGDLGKLPVEEAVARLHDRLRAAREAKVRLDQFGEHRLREEVKLAEARSTINKERSILDAMCREAECASPDQLPDVEQRSTRRRTVERQLGASQSRLLELAVGAPVEAFIAEATAVDPDQLRPMIEQLEEELGQLEHEKSELLVAIGSERAELKRMDGSGEAARANEQAQVLKAQIRADADRYVRLRLASAVLRSAIEQFRAESQGPVLRRASELFAELTLGSFQGLRADYDGRGDAVMVGVRADGRSTVGVAGMSDGTCDQLYLALRLASLEHHLDHNNPIPFVVDDILIKFDDDRSVAALKALAQLSERTQVIFFTHHEH